MGILDLFKKKDKNKENKAYAAMLNGNTPIFSQFGTNIYASDVVQQAINCIVTEMKKLTPKHVLKDNPIDSNIQHILNDPNELMTTCEFLEKCTWFLYLNYNCFIYPKYELKKDPKTGEIKRNYLGFYPLNPSQVDFLVDQNGNYFCKFHFQNGYEFTFDYRDIIHWRLKYSVNEFMGGNELGQPDNQVLLETLEINHLILQSLPAALKSSLKINGIFKYGSVIGKDDLEKEKTEFEEKLQNNKSGFVLMDLKSEYIPVKADPKLVDKDTLEFVNNKILSYIGVPLPIYLGDFSKDQHEAFYQKTIEHLVISLGQAFTKKVFRTSAKQRGHQIVFYPEELVFMTMDQKIEVAKMLGERGALTDNQQLKILGLPPYPGGDIRKVSLNYVNANIADKYQLNNAGANEEGENEE